MRSLPLRLYQGEEEEEEEEEEVLSLMIIILQLLRNIIYATGSLMQSSKKLSPSWATVQHRLIIHVDRLVAFCLSELVAGTLSHWDITSYLQQSGWVGGGECQCVFSSWV